MPRGARGPVARAGSSRPSRGRAQAQAEALGKAGAAAGRCTLVQASSQRPWPSASARQCAQRASSSNRSRKGPCVAGATLRGFGAEDRFQAIHCRDKQRSVAKGRRRWARCARGTGTFAQNGGGRGLPEPLPVPHARSGGDQVREHVGRSRAGAGGRAGLCPAALSLLWRRRWPRARRLGTSAPALRAPWRRAGCPDMLGRGRAPTSGLLVLLLQTQISLYVVGEKVLGRKNVELHVVIILLNRLKNSIVVLYFC